MTRTSRFVAMALVATVAGPLLPGMAEASFIFNLQRNSDTEVLLTVLPNPDPPATFSAPTPSARGARVFLKEPFGTYVGGGLTLADNTLAASTPVSTLLSATADTASNWPAPGGYVPELFLAFSVNHTAGSVISGSVKLTLPAGNTWKPVGSSGEIRYGRNNSAVPLTQTGMWQIVAGVPEPGTLALLCCGAVGLLGYIWRRNKLA